MCSWDAVKLTFPEKKKSKQENIIVPMEVGMKQFLRYKVSIGGIENIFPIMPALKV